MKLAGQSRATPQLRQDLLVETAPLGDKREPRTLPYCVDVPQQHLYERWTADGTKRAFPVALWPTPKGGAGYKVVEVPPGTEP